MMMSPELTEFEAGHGGVLCHPLHLLPEEDSSNSKNDEGWTVTDAGNEKQPFRLLVIAGGGT